MRGGHRYRHDHCLDIDIDVVKVSYVGPTYLKLRVLYWHRTLRAPISFEPETVKIMRRDLHRGRDITGEDS